MTTPKTLHQMAEEYALSLYQSVDEPLIQRMGRDCAAIGYLAGAQAALRLPEVQAIIGLAADYSSESCSPNCGECWPCDFEKALAAFDQLLSEGAK